MNNIDYYKSLISDEEVIKALVKESKAREGELLKAKTRVRPNLNFFQRTVTNLVTSNERVTTTRELVRKEAERSIAKDIRRGKLKIARTKETVTEKRQITFVKAKDVTALVGTQSKVACSDSPVDKAYKEHLGKYFVRASDANSSQVKVKPKGIMFNLNFGKDKFVPVSGREQDSVSVTEDSDREVINISSESSSSTSSDSDVQILDSDSD
ncbi:hypothetical protein NQ315_002381 [Exocentrus adspersus]|uniref:Uncharacterized protein n=1 Tax=Exocentrus adspersus TaxID=1586481 RepID=A0AAV8VT92_9CUCU|nr:hypothetical protein NQ315_002381 [Exocentrus adspersus]